ncbi:DUF3526 domain-containing protein [Thalassotalea marina]|uniref:DUF3526 domain-containing protein n=1 Tax=Thalassotalea marina TaxID=1673741 RepID=A0A919BBV6_9GAMM|nr:DUF3526 domain-containing protein [Thalassotalea marina]GHF77962.1 hypothetical protein GCM10017161_01240 [Thalassotalea marina]
MLKFELKLLFQGLANKLAIAIFLISGGLAIYFGAQGYQAIKVDQLKSEAMFAKEVEYVKKREAFPEAGSLAYYAFSPTQWQLSPWSALFVGQSQDNYVAMKVRALALQGQIYNREINNPNQQKAGRLDLGFVLIYLLPILIGTLCVTLLADERHEGRWRMLLSLSQGGISLLWRRLVLRLVFTVGLILLFFITSALLLSLPLDGVFFWFIIASIIYAMIWFVIAGIIIGAGKSSVFSSLAFVSTWLVVTILVPGSIHLYLNHAYANNSAVEAALEQRLVMNNGWDQDKQATLDQFLADYPQYQNTSKLGEAFDWKWYYAQQHMSDLAVANEWNEYKTNQQQRTALLDTLSVLSPSLFFQHKFNQVANTDSGSYLAYLASIEAYHQHIREFFYPYLFTDKAFTPDAVDDFPKFETPQQVNQFSFVTLFIVLLLLCPAIFWVNKYMKRLTVD